MQDRPSAGELLEAVEAFIREQARPRLTGAARFHALVAENVLRIVARELELEPTASEEERRRLVGVLGGDPDAAEGADLDELGRALCRRIEAGEADSGPWRRKVLAYLEQSVRVRLAIDNPDFDPSAGHGDRGEGEDG